MSLLAATPTSKEVADEAFEVIVHNEKPKKSRFYQTRINENVIQTPASHGFWRERGL